MLCFYITILVISQSKSERNFKMLKDNIKKARLDAGLTQLEVAEKLGVAQAQYARWESGGRNPKDETVEKLAEILNTSFEILKGRDDGLEEIVSLLREHELTEEDKNQIISLLQDFLINNSMYDELPTPNPKKKK